MDEHNLTGTQESLGYHQGADGIVTDYAACIAYHVRIPFFEAKHPVHVEASIHTGDNRKASRWGSVKGTTLAEALYVLNIVLQDIIYR